MECRASVRSTLSFLRTDQLPLRHLSAQSRGEGRFPGRLRVPAQVVSGASVSARADLDRRGVLQAQPTDAEGRADAARISDTDQVRLPVRLRVVSGSRAAFVSDIGRGDGSVQPGVSDLLQ